MSEHFPPAVAEPKSEEKAGVDGLAPAHSQASGFRYGLYEILGINI